MDKLLLIIKREYLTRVTKKTFILATLLTPIGIGLIAVISGYFASQSGSAEKNIVIKDDSNILNEENMKSTYLHFNFSSEDVDSLNKHYVDRGYDLFVHVPALQNLAQKKLEVDYLSGEKLGLSTIEAIERKIESAVKAYKIEQSDFDKSMLDDLDVRVTLDNAITKSDDESIKGDRSSKFSIGIATGLSYIMGFLMYMVIFVFGMMVMRSVMEEKINRIVEVMISSVKPIQLMLGKIIGVGLVGLTQLGIWLLLIPLILFGITMVFGVDASSVSGGEQMAQAQEMVKEMNDSGFVLADFITELKAMNWLLIIPSFIIFFLGGYFIYSSLFAAVGSAIGDDLGEGQQLMLPVMIPVILAFVMIPAVFQDPNGPVALFGSLFPLFSPIIMPARLPFDPPMWQLLLSMVLLIASVIFFAWLAGRIYRVGIFMYGKKVSFKELGKWLFYKG